jgi:hypothetical protein
MSNFEELIQNHMKYGKHNKEIVLDPKDFEKPLSEIQEELIALVESSDKGVSIDENRFDYLLKLQEHNKDYQQFLEEERENWIDSVSEFCEQCLERMRSFVPSNIFDCSAEDLVALGINPELARRIRQRQCLWLIRMSKEEISRLHESDLLGRFNSMQQHLDIIETAAVYWSIPRDFAVDPVGRKSEWRHNIEENLRKMLLDNDEDQLPDYRIRNPAYNDLQYGPVKDLTSVRDVEVTKAEDITLLGGKNKRRSFLEVCSTNSIVSKLKNT